MLASVHIVQLGTIACARLCFIYCANTGLLLGTYLVTLYLSCYMIVYFAVFGAAFGLYIVRVGWTQRII